MESKVSKQVWNQVYDQAHAKVDSSIERLVWDLVNSRVSTGVYYKVQDAVRRGVDSQRIDRVRSKVWEELL